MTRTETTRRHFLELIAVSAAVGFDSRLLADIVNDGGRLQPSVARAKRPERIADMATYLKWKWRTDVSNHATGLDNDALKKGLDAVLAEWKAKEPWPVVKARLVDYLVDNCALGFSKFDCFPAISCWNRWDRPISKILWDRECEVEKSTAPAWLADARREINESGGKCYRDYDHSSPDWAVILKLGFPGMKARVDAYPDTPFYAAEKRTAAAILRFLDRLVAAAEQELARCGGKTEEGLLEREIESLKRLRVGPPVTAFDVMLHASSVSGEKGLVALRAICEEYFAAGGCGLNLNIQSVEELKDAQLHPEKYENLQVRVAGWNIRWNDIPKKEQDGFIRRLEAMPE